MDTTANVVRLYREIENPDTGWYRRANKWCKSLAESTGYNQNVVTAVVAALSPGCTWGRNMEDARALLGRISDWKYSTYPYNINKAIDLMSGPVGEAGILKRLRPNKNSGQKCHAFFLNLRHPLKCGPVTVDRHAIAVVLGRVATPRERRLTDAQYRWFVDVYTRAADIVGVRPHEIQAATWVEWRQRLGE